MAETPKTAGALLSEWRKANGKSQTECAADIDVRQATWSEWESDSKSPQIKYAIRIARLTGGAVPVEAWEPLEAVADPASTPPPPPVASDEPKREAS